MRRKFCIVCLISAALILIQPLCSVIATEYLTGADDLKSVGTPVAGDAFAGAAYAEDGEDGGTEDAEDGESGDEEPPEEVDTSDLEQALKDAENAKKGVRPSTDGTDIAVDKLWAPQSAYNSLNASIREAKRVLDDASSTQSDIDAQSAGLEAAIEEFERSVQYGTKPDGEDDSKEVVDVLYLKMDEPGADGKTHFVGEDFDKKYKSLSIDTKGKTLQLNGYYTTNKSDGAMYETADSTSPLGEVVLNWESSDDEIATVSPTGYVTAISDGEVTITATVRDEIQYGEKAPSKSVTINISGQTAEYVKSVTIIDKDGNSRSKDDYDVTIIEGKNKFFEFYALVTWHDPKTDKDRVEDTRTDTVTSSIKWAVGGSSVVATINEDTGRLKTTEYSGNCFVQCTVTGGVGGKAVKDTARVQVDTGEYAYKPADSLTLSVVYQEFPDKTVQTHKYSLSELAGKLSTVTNSYTVIGGGRYGVIRAAGYLFKDVVALEGIDIDDVYQFRFGTADGYDNPVTSKLLYGSGARYYFPNWDIGSRAEARVVPPLLAYESNMVWGESYADSGTPMDEGTRFRLVFGPLWGGESNSSYQIYFIHSITIVLSGAPPADNEKPKDDDSEKDDEPNREEDKDDATVGVIGTDVNGGGAGGGIGVGGRSGASGGESGTGGDSGGDGSPASGQSRAGPGTERSAPAEAGVQDRTSGNGVIPFDGSGRYKVYEMISNSDTNVAPLNMDLPYLGAAGPLAGGCVAAGGISFLIGFRRRLL